MPEVLSPPNLPYQHSLSVLRTPIRVHQRRRVIRQEFQVDVIPPPASFTSHCRKCCSFIGNDTDGEVDRNRGNGVTGSKENNDEAGSHVELALRVRRVRQTTLSGDVEVLVEDLHEEWRQQYQGAYLEEPWQNLSRNVNCAQRDDRGDLLTLLDENKCPIYGNLVHTSSEVVSADGEILNPRFDDTAVSVDCAWAISNPGRPYHGIFSKR
ncbi:hypothetical protein CPB83DRAFT_840417 [Crepidotus variabilis]|uniref:Uncharacterized protein n=1 Tax=Crepidotus variabilis TaxID=179855 RepID=A0A9P6E4R2_9AGAR|nr:hypothetical protein CPB83DRAFT_840417 [Crepidotus variabilis]